MLRQEKGPALICPLDIFKGSLQSRCLCLHTIETKVNIKGSKPTTHPTTSLQPLPKSCRPLDSLEQPPLSLGAHSFYFILLLFFSHNVHNFSILYKIYMILYLN